MAYAKGKRVRITTIDGQVVSGKSLGIDKAIWGRKRTPESTLRIETRDTIVAIPVRNIKRKR